MGREEQMYAKQLKIYIYQAPRWHIPEEAAHFFKAILILNKILARLCKNTH
jgi:hypothetical protein